MATVRELFVELGVDYNNKGLKQFEKGLSSLKSSFAQIGMAIAGLGASMGVFLNEAGKMEQYEISFNTVLKSAEKTKFLMSELKKLTEETPFKFEDTVLGAKNLLAVGVPLEKITTELRMLGDLAAGSGGPMSTMVKVYRRNLAKGTVEMEALNMMTDQGIPILQKLADTIGVTTGETMKLIEQRKVTADIFMKTIKRMTSAGGLYFNAMIAQSKSLFGIWSVLKDNFTILFADIGKEFLPMAKSLAKTFLEFVRANREFIKTNIVRFFQKLGRAATDFISSLRYIANLFGGLTRLAVGLAIAFGLLFAAKILVGIGNLVIGFVKLAGALGLANMIAFIVPLLVGLAVAAFILFLDDLVHFWKGNESIIGEVIDYFKEKFPKALEVATGAFKIFAGWMGVIMAGLKAIAGFWTNLFQGNLSGAFKSLGDFFTKNKGFEKMLEGAKQIARVASGPREKVSERQWKTDMDIARLEHKYVNNITVNAPGGDPGKVRRAVSQGFGDVIRQTDINFKKAGP